MACGGSNDSSKNGMCHFPYIVQCKPSMCTDTSDTETKEESETIKKKEEETDIRTDLCKQKF